MRIAHSRLRALTIDWRRLTTMLLALAGLIAATLAWASYSYAARTEPVVITAAPIAPGTRITPDMLTIVQAPLMRPEPLRGLPDPAPLIGAYARVELSAGQVLQADLVQATPLDRHTFTNDPLPSEALRDDVFELALTGIASVNTQDHINILVLIDADHGKNPSFSVGQLDAPGSGPRVVRALANLNVVHVDEKAAYLDVTHTQSQYLWALAAAKIPFVGEIATTLDAPLGPLRVSDANLALLEMANPGQSVTSVTPPAVVLPTAAPVAPTQVEP
jgi:hypothetical protein